MVTSFVRRPLSWMVAISMLVLVFALAACGDSGSTASTSSSGSTSGSTTSSTAAQTVTVKESKAAGKADVYTCDPTSISIKQGDTVQFTNQTDETQDFDQGDAQKAGVDFVMAINQSTTATFKTAGTFTVTSEKGASITVTVQ